MAAPGPSLIPVDAGVPIIAVQDAHRLLPWAEVLYGCENSWWEVYDGVPEFTGEKWSSHTVQKPGEPVTTNDKTEAQEQWKLRCVEGRSGEIFSTDPQYINYGNNSGFQAINLAILFGCTTIVLIGFDMQRTGGKAHFFGDHPKGLNRGTDYTGFHQFFINASQHMPEGVRIINSTMDSALTCFPKVELDDAIALLSQTAA